MDKLMLSMIRGKVGNVIVKHYAYGIVVSKVPDMPNINPTQPQQVKRAAFKEAVAYAQSILRDPEKKAAYQKTLKRGKNVYQGAIKEFFGRYTD